MSESKQCGCEAVDIQFWGPNGVDYTICFCPLHESAPDGLALAKAVLASDIGADAGSVFADSARQCAQIVELARKVKETAEPRIVRYRAEPKEPTP